MSGTVEQAIAYAQAQLGQPYLWGGDGAGGFDCSGLVQAAFRAAGVALPRTAQQQYDATPRVVAPAAGDLVFYGNSPSDITHVGIYLGGGKMLDAPHTGAQVRIENVWSGVIGYGRPLAGGATDSATAAAASSSGSTATLTSSSSGGFLANIGSTLSRFTVEGIALGGGVLLVGLGIWKGTTVGRHASRTVHDAAAQASNAAQSAPAAGGGGKGKATGEGAAGGESVAAELPEMAAAL